MSYYEFVQLDPRPGRENPEIDFIDFGIEVTIPGSPNDLDHHGEGATAETPAACEQALSCELPLEGATLATVRPDADSVTAMAVLESRATGCAIDKQLVAAIGLMDRYGPKVEGELYQPETVVAIARMAPNFRIPMAGRVAFVQACLDGTVDMDEVARLVAERDVEYAAAEEASDVTIIIPGYLVFVQSTHRFATTIGYRHATTVVAFNPEMPILERGADGRMKPTGETYKKFTVCRWDSNVKTDLAAALAELQALESGWGGRGDIFGSPQNRDSELDVEAVLEIVRKHVHAGD